MFQNNTRTVNLALYYQRLNNQIEINRFEKEILDTLEYIYDKVKVLKNTDVVLTFVRGTTCMHLMPFEMESQLDTWLLQDSSYGHQPRDQQLKSKIWTCPFEACLSQCRIHELVQDCLLVQLYESIKKHMNLPRKKCIQQVLYDIQQVRVKPNYQNLQYSQFESMS